MNIDSGRFRILKKGGLMPVVCAIGHAAFRAEWEGEDESGASGPPLIDQSIIRSR